MAVRNHGNADNDDANNNAAADPDLSLFRRKIHAEIPFTNDPMQTADIFAIVSETREYPWGTVESTNGNHSDLLYLRHLLFRMGFIDAIRDKTNNITDELEKKRRIRRILAIRLGLLLLFALLYRLGTRFGLITLEPLLLLFNQSSSEPADENSTPSDQFL